jgi:hypothetical protein
MLVSWLRLSVHQLASLRVMPAKFFLELNPPDGLDAAERRWLARCATTGKPLLNVKRPDLPRQLCFRFPYSLDERRRFPFNQWLAAQGVGLTDLHRYLMRHDWWGSRSTLERLASGYYEVVGRGPPKNFYHDIESISQLAGISVLALVYPTRHLSHSPAS